MTYVSAFRRPSQFATVGDQLRADAEAAGIPLRTLEQIQDCIAQCRKQKSDKTMARLMLKAGRMTDEARAWLAAEYPAA
jgi:hypothetical protein